MLDKEAHWIFGPRQVCVLSDVKELGSHRCTLGKALHLSFQKILLAAESGEWVRESQVGMERGVEEYEIAQRGDDAGLDWTTSDILSCIIFAVEGCPGHCRLLRSCPGLYQLDVSSILSPQV